MPSFQEILSKPSIFKDVSALSPHYVPEILPFRDRQIEEVMTVVSPALRSKRARNLIIYGKTGTGKTVSVKRVMEDFKKAANNATMHYLNCRIYNSRYRILQKVLKNLIPEMDKPGYGLTVFYEKLKETLEKGHQTVIVLDEIDMVKDLDDLVYTITRINDEVKNGGTSIIGISNKLSFKDALDPRSRSSLYETEMVFPPYTSEQLQQILSQRSKVGFIENAVENSAINLTAAVTAQENGDARYALKLLLKAGEMAEIEKRTKVSDIDVEAARRKVEIDLAAETINTLPENHQIVLYSIAQISLSGSKYSRLDGVAEGFLFSGEVYEQYENTCKKLKKRARSSRWFQEYLNDLEMLGLITTTPSSKGVRGHTTLIRIGLSASDVEMIVKKNLFDQ